MSYFFTADEHYRHKNIIKYSNRPFANISHMETELIKRHNEVVLKNDTTIHIGDTAFCNKQELDKIILQLNGKHIFVRGSHDGWMKDSKNYYHDIYELTIDEQKIFCCHYAMKNWPKSHYGSWLIHGHSHGELKKYEKTILEKYDTLINDKTSEDYKIVKQFLSLGKSVDVGVDCWNYYPVSFDQISKYMQNRPDNIINHVRKNEK